MQKWQQQATVVTTNAANTATTSIEIIIAAICIVSPKWTKNVKKSSIYCSFDFLKNVNFLFLCIMIVALTQWTLISIAVVCVTDTRFNCSSCCATVVVYSTKKYCTRWSASVGGSSIVGKFDTPVEPWIAVHRRLSVVGSYITLQCNCWNKDAE